jgi:hypothetical protein
MRKIFLFLLFFASFASAGFYFDLSLAPCFRHLEATHSSYVQNQGSYKEYLGYNGGGGLVSVRFGGLIKNTVAIFGGPKVEITKGKNSGWDKDRRHPSSIFMSVGPGVTVFPFSRSTEDNRNIYITATTNIHLGSGGNIGLLGTNVGLETGFLWQTSERFYSGIVVGAEYTSTAGFYAKQENEKGYSIWLGFKFIRK